MSPGRRAAAAPILTDGSWRGTVTPSAAPPYQPLPDNISTAALPLRPRLRAPGSGGSGVCAGLSRQPAARPPARRINRGGERRRAPGSHHEAPQPAVLLRGLAPAPRHGRYPWGCGVLWGRGCPVGVVGAREAVDAYGAVGTQWGCRFLLGLLVLYGAVGAPRTGGSYRASCAHGGLGAQQGWGCAWCYGCPWVCGCPEGCGCPVSPA